MRYLTDRKRAVGSGSGSEGTQHHWKMIVSSISLAVIAPFFIFTFGAGLGGTYEEVLAYFSRPFVVLVMALGLLVGLNHFAMEVDEAIEDYVHGIAGKLLLVAVNAVKIVLIVAGLFALLKLAL